MTESLAGGTAKPQVLVVMAKVWYTGGMKQKILYVAIAVVTLAFVIWPLFLIK
jgi:hypothetical protein